MSGRVPQLISALGSSGYPEEFDFNADHLPYALCLVANQDRLELWGGTPSAPFEYLFVGWDEVIDVVPTQVQELGRWSRGLLVSLRSSDGSRAVDLPFVVLGRGFAGLFPETEASVAGTATRIRAFKTASEQ